MVNASLNFASLVGILLFGWWLISVPASASQVLFVLTRRADTSSSVVVKSVHRIVIGLGRLAGLPLVALILFFQGWRLDPLLQFAIFLLAIGLIAESMTGAVDDYQAWRNRLGHASAGYTALRNRVSRTSSIIPNSAQPAKAVIKQDPYPSQGALTSPPPPPPPPPPPAV